MAVELTDRGISAIEAAGSGAYQHPNLEAAFFTECGGDESPRQSLGLRVTEDRVLIKADREEHAPEQTASGLYVASSMAAAVDGSDAGESWFVGTIVQLGPLVNYLDVRSRVVRWLTELEDEGHDILPAEIRVLRERVEALPRQMPDPLNVGDRVTFSWASGQQIAVGEDKYLIMRAGDVLAVLENE
jgi:co-chaperonin GroES (HSP10)